MESLPEKQQLSPESQERIRLINETNYQLEHLSDFRLDTAGGREGLKLALHRIFANAEAIEGTEYEIIGLIKGRIRDTYSQLYSIKFNDESQSTESRQFYGEIEEIMTMIEDRGKRFIEDMDIYKRFNEEREAA